MQPFLHIFVGLIGLILVVILWLAGSTTTQWKRYISSRAMGKRKCGVMWAKLLINNSAMYLHAAQFAIRGCLENLEIGWIRAGVWKTGSAYNCLIAIRLLLDKNFGSTLWAQSAYTCAGQFLIHSVQVVRCQFKPLVLLNKFTGKNSRFTTSFKDTWAVPLSRILSLRSQF